MSRIFDALRQAELERSGTPPTPPVPEAPPPEAPAPVPTPPPRARAPKAPPRVALDSTAQVNATPLEQSRIATLTASAHLAMEKFRILAVRLKLLGEQKSLRTLVVTSGVAEDGKSFVSINLAAALADVTKQRVLLLEGDVRKPVQSNLLGVTPAGGLTDAIADPGQPWSAYVQHVENLNIWVMTAGTRTSQDAPVLHDPKLPALLKRLSESFDWIIIDSPPLTPLADVNVWSRYSDGILLVVRQGHTPRKLLREGVEGLHKPNIVGLVINQSDEMEHSYYGYYMKRYGQKRPAPTEAPA